MAKYTQEEWLAEAKKRFGNDPKNWKFVCPACGHVQTQQEFIDAGSDLDAYYSCIGRATGKGSPVDGDSSGCNWTAGCFFGTLGKGDVVITPDGKEHDVFRLADPE